MYQTSRYNCYHEQTAEKIKSRNILLHKDQQPVSKAQRILKGDWLHTFCNNIDEENEYFRTIIRNKVEIFETFFQGSW